MRHNSYPEVNVKRSNQKEVQEHQQLKEGNKNPQNWPVIIYPGLRRSRNCKKKKKKNEVTYISIGNKELKLSFSFWCYCLTRKFKRFQ